MTNGFSIGDRVRIKEGANLSKAENQRRHDLRVVGTIKPRQYGDSKNCERVQWNGETGTEIMFAGKLELAPEHSLKVGDKVTHVSNPQYGTGTIAEIGGTGKYSEIKVDWPSRGECWNTASFLTPVETKVEPGLDPSSVRAKTLTSLKADRLAKLRNIGTNQTTVDELNDKIERDTALVQELDDLIRDIEKPTKDEPFKIGDTVYNKYGTGNAATIVELGEKFLIVESNMGIKFTWSVENVFKR